MGRCLHVSWQISVELHEFLYRVFILWTHDITHITAQAFFSNTFRGHNFQHILWPFKWRDTVNTVIYRSHVLGTLLN
jgi:hypothetical protein